jgi:hypothetical protein
MAADLPAATVLAMPAPTELVAIPALDPEEEAGRLLADLRTAFAQERQAEHATEALRDLLPPRARVRRGGALIRHAHAARTTVIVAREDLEIAFQVHQLLGNNTNKESTDDLDVLRRVS